MISNPLTATFLFTDLENSTPLWENHPRLMHDLSARHDMLMRQAIEAHRGRVVKTTGDGFHAVFETASEGLAAALAGQRALLEEPWPEETGPLLVRMGLHTGESRERDGDYYGSEVNRAARVMGVAHGGQILVSRATAALIRTALPEDVTLLELGEHRLRGLGLTENLAQVCHPNLPRDFPSLNTQSLSKPNLQESSGMIPIPERRWSQPMVGRQEEMGQLVKSLDALQRGQGALVFLVGEAGIGKTRLAYELARRGRTEGVQFISGRAQEQDQRAPYHPWLEILKKYIDWATPELQSLALEEVGSELSILLPDLGLGRPKDSADQDREEQRRRLFAAITKFITNISKQTPLILFLDDIHWAQETSLQLLHFVAEQTRKERILIVASFRPIEMEERPNLSHIISNMNRDRLFQTLKLTRLTASESGRIVAGHLDQEELPDLEAILFKKSEGNPFFIEELVLYLKQEGKITLTKSGWQVGELEKIQMPGAISAVIEERLQKATPITRQTLAFASVIGTEFQFPILQKGLKIDEEALFSAVEEALVMKFLIERRLPGDEAYVFADEVIRDVLYEQLSSIRRRRYHLDIAKAIENTYHNQLEKWVEQLSYHFLAGNDTVKAIDYTMQAGDKAAGVYAWTEAIDFYHLVLDLLPDGDSARRAAVYDKLSELLFFGTTNNAELIAEYAEKALIHYQELGDKHNTIAMHLRLMMLYTGLNWDGAREYRALEHLKAIAALVEDDPDHPDKALIYARTAHIYLHMGNPREALEWSQKVVDIYARLNMSMGTGLGTAKAYVGQVDDGFPYSEGCWDIVLKLDNLVVTSVFGHELALTYALVRNVPKARYWGRKVLNVLEKSGSDTLAGQLWRPLALTYALSGEIVEGQRMSRAQVNLEEQTLFGCYYESAAGVGLYYLRRGAWPKAEESFRRQLAVHQERRNFGAISACAYGLGLLRMENGDYPEANSLLLQSLEICRAGGNVLFELWVLPALVHLSIAKGQMKEAAMYVEQGFSILGSGQEWYGLPAGMHLARAQVSAAAGDWEAAEKDFARSITLNEQFEMPWDRARTYYIWSEMLLHRDETKDRFSARQMLSQALTLFQRIDARQDIKKVNELLNHLET